MIFTPDDVLARLHERPFPPMRIVTTTGQTYDIYHPDLVFVAKRFLIVGTPSPDSEKFADQVTRVPLIHISELRDLPVKTTPPSNGHQP